MSWSKQVALVTGASRGIGRAIALRLAREGAAVAVNYANRADEADTTAQTIRHAGGRAVTVQADVGDAAQIAPMVERVAHELDPVTILVNNAGVSVQAPLEGFDPAVMDRMRRVNVDGPIHLMRAVVPAMRERRYGRIVNVTSIAAIGTSLPGNAFYAASKAELMILTRRFAMELGRDGITVNAVAPGFIRTEMTRRQRSEAEYAELLQRLGERAMVGRAGEPEDIANAVAFLAAPEAGFITAQWLTVDGGRMDYIGHA